MHFLAKNCAVCGEKVSTLLAKNCALYFTVYNTSGIDKYKGQDIGIIGTFYKRGEEYKLIAAYLGAEVNTKEDLRPKERRVSYNKKSFLITTYKEPLLQEIQIS